MQKSFFLIVIFFSIFIAGCTKEYSYEGSNTNTVVDTTHPPSVIFDFPSCNACAGVTNAKLSQWNFKYKNTLLCGKADTAIINLERTAFTFFGASTCSADTGIVVTVYLDTTPLVKDMSNVTVSKIAFYYYDRITPSYIFMSLPGSSINASITSYVHQTKIVTGTFNGGVFRSNGENAIISAGSFQMKIL